MTTENTAHVRIKSAQTLYELTLACSDALFDGVNLSAGEREYIRDRFLDGVSSPETVRRFHASVNAPSAANGDTREMYPLFYIPAYRDNGAKYRTVTGLLPATHILSANAYELEILRILALTVPGDRLVLHMLERTRRRLDTTCFGKFCRHGECYDAGAAVIRFYAAAFPNYSMRMRRIFEGLAAHHEDKARTIGSDLYILLALSEADAINGDPDVRAFIDRLQRRLLAASPKNERAVYYTIQLLKRCAPPETVARKRGSLLMSGSSEGQLQIV